MFPVVVNWFCLVAKNVKENGRKFWLFSPSALVFLLSCYFIWIPGGKTKVIGVWVESRFFFFFLSFYKKKNLYYRVYFPIPLSISYR